MLMGIVSGKSGLKSCDSSCASAFRAITVMSSVSLTLSMPQFCRFALVLRTLESLLDVHSLLCARLKVWNATLGLAERLRPLRADHPLAVLHIDLVAEHHEREALWVHRAGLDQELVPP